jgi:hypothetical protein
MISLDVHHGPREHLLELAHEAGDTRTRGILGILRWHAPLLLSQHRRHPFGLLASRIADGGDLVPQHLDPPEVARVDLDGKHVAG